MNKKKIIGIASAILVALIFVVVGIWWFLGRETNETGGNKLGIEWYDVNGKEFTISTVDELYEFAQLSNYYDFKDQTIKLGADIVVNEGNATDWKDKAPRKKWSPISGFNGIFDGQGHTISGLYATGFDTPIALFTNTASECQITDLSLKNTYFETWGFGGTASIASNGGGKFSKIYSDAILNVTGGYSGYAGGICSKLNLQSTIDECWYDGVISVVGRDAGGIVDNVLGCRVTISHSLFSGEIHGTWKDSGSRYGGLVGRVYKAGAGLILNDSLSTGKITAENLYYTGSVVGASMGSTSLTTTETYGSLSTYGTAIGRSGSNGTINSFPLELRENELLGSKAYQWTNLDFNEYWAVVEDNTPILQYFAQKIPSVDGLEKEFDTSWYTAGASEYIIMDKADLYGLYYLSASNAFSGKTIKVGADIVLNEGSATDWEKTEPEHAWYPVIKFAGTFDGQGHTISGLYINTSGEKVGLFKETTYEATVKNLSLKNSFLMNTATVNVMMGGISGRGGGTFDTIYSDAIMVSYGSIVGGIFGQVNAEAKNLFTNCWFDGSITMRGEKARYVGGIAGGVVKGNTTFAHCLNTAPISQLDYKDAGMFVGGITGYIINKGVIGTITDCLNTGKILVNYHAVVGSVIGRSYNAAVTITDTYATTESYTYKDGTFKGIGTASSGYTGGVIGLSESVISGYGGYQWTTLNFADYWATVVSPDETPILKSFANKVPSLSGVAKMVDTSWYSADKTSFVLNDLADLYGFCLMSGQDTFKDKTVKLGADIVVNQGNAAEWATKAPANPWFPISKFAGTFDGQGHTISGVYLKTDGTYVGLFSQTSNTSTVKNLKLENSYFESTIVKEMAALGSIAGEMGGALDTVYSNAIVVGYGKQIGGMIGRVNRAALEKYKIKNCWFDGEVKVHNEVAQMAYIGGIAGTLVQGYLDMNNCLNSGTVRYTYDKLPTQNDGSPWGIGVYVGGILGGIMNGTSYNEDGTLKRVGEWNVSDTLNSGLVYAGKPDGSKQENGNTFANGAGSFMGYTTGGTLNMDNVYTTTESCTKRTISYNSSKATVTGGVMQVSEDIISGLGGYQFTDLDFATYWAAKTNPDETPVLRAFATTAADLTGVAKLVDFSWYNADATSYVLDSKEDLFGFAVLSGSDNFKGKTVKLGANIDLNPGWTAGATAPKNEWIPILSFAGTFDGNGKTISGIYVNANSAYAGLFSVTTNTSTIKNFKIENSYFTSTANGMQALGSVAGQMGGKMKQIYSNAIVVGKGTQIGGMVGRVNQSASSEYKIDECWFDGSVTVQDDVAQMAYIGGIVGANVQGTLKMKNCLNTGTITYAYDKLPLKEGEVQNIGVHVGGLVGGVMNGVRKDKGTGTPSKVHFTDCMNGKLVVSGLKDGSKVSNGAGSVFGYTTSGTVDMDNVYAVSYTDSDKNVVTRTHHNNGTQADVTGSVQSKDKATLIGLRGYTYTTLNFKNFWAARTGDVPAIKHFVTNAVDLTTAWRPDTSWISDAKGTTSDPYKLYDVADLYGFAQLVNEGNDFAGKTVKVVAENGIDVNPSWTVDDGEPTNLWTPIGNYENPFRGVFEGNNKTISGLYTCTSSQYVGLFGCAEDAGKLNGEKVYEQRQDCIIQNLRLTNSYFEYTGTETARMGSIVGYGEGTYKNIYSNATLKSAGPQVGGLIGRVQLRDDNKYGPNTLIDVENCWFEGSIDVSCGDNAYVGGLIGYSVYGTTDVKNCLYTGNIDISYTGTQTTLSKFRMGGLVGSDNGNNGKVHISNCLSAGNITITTADSNISTKFEQSGAVIGRLSATSSVANTYATTDFGPAIGEGEGEAIPIAKSNLLGIKGYQFTKLDFDTQTGAWSVREGEVPAPKAIVGEGLPTDGYMRVDVSWLDEAEGTAIDPYIIATVEELYGLAYVVNGGNPLEGKTVKLADNIDGIDLNEGWVASAIAPENVWTPIGSCTNTDEKTGNYFAGTFDGNNKTIKGLYVNATDGSAGLFGFTVDSTIRNLRIENSYMTSSFNMLGSVIGYGEGLLYNVYSEATLNSSKAQVGGLIGRIQDKTGGSSTAKDRTNCDIINCEYTGAITTSAGENARCGGFVGYAIYGTTNIYNSIAKANISVTNSEATRVGGIIGQDNGSSTIVNMKNCIVAGTLTGGAACGSVIGGVRADSVTVENSVYVSATYTQAVYGDKKDDASLANLHPTVVDFSDTEKLTEAVSVLNTNATENNNNAVNITWNTWNSENGLPIFGEAPAGSIIDVTPDTSWFVGDGPYLLADAGDLYGFAKLVNEGESFTGKTVKLADDITLNNAYSNNKWTSIGNASNQFCGTFDGNQRTIVGVRVDGTTLYSGLFGYVGANGVVKNLTLENSSITSTGQNTAAVVGNFEGSLVSGIYCKKDVSVSGSANAVGGIVGRSGATSGQIVNCWFAGTVTCSEQYCGGILGRLSAGGITIANCVNTGILTNTKDDANAFTGGIVGGAANESTTMTMKNCVSAGSVTAKATGSVGSVIGRTNKVSASYEDVYTTDNITNSAGSAWATKNNYPGAGSYSTGGLASGSDTPEIVNLATNGVLARTLLALNSNVNENNSLSTRVVDWDDWVALDGKPVLEQFANKTINTVADTSWYNTTDTTYYLMDEGDLAGLAALVNDTTSPVTFEGKTINLVANIKFNEGNATDWGSNPPANEWTPIGTAIAAQSFRGIFNGNGMTISGLYIESGNKCLGLFGNTKDSIIRNVFLRNSYIESTITGSNAAQVGSIAGYGDGTFENIYTDAILVGSGQRNGGIIGAVQDGVSQNKNGTSCDIKKCWFDGSITITSNTSINTNTGGMIGYALHGVNTIQNSLFTGTINYTNTGTGNQVNARIGGFVGALNGSTASTIDISNSYSAGSITGTNIRLLQTGSLVGRNTVTVSGNVYVTNQCFEETGDYTTAEGAVVGKVDIGETSMVSNLGNAWEAVTTAIDNKYKVVLKSLKQAVAK